jgi:tRNA threonylcarbamoyladenosine biosynthesis protein TsaB
MVLLALDTSTADGSVALWRDGLVEERAGDSARSHAERLPGELAALLTAHGLTPRDVERYAVAAGPGSFTGLRIGIATVQGLALVNDRLVHAVGTLDLLAHDAARAADADTGTQIVAWMEAYRGEVFAARYRVARAADPEAADRAGEVAATAARTRGTAILEPMDAPTVSAPAPLAEAWGAGRASRVIVTGDGVARTAALLTAAFGPAVVLRSPGPLAGTLAALAARQPDAATRPHAVSPIYVRRPDVEIARDRAAIRPTA